MVNDPQFTVKLFQAPSSEQWKGSKLNEKMIRVADIWMRKLCARAIAVQEYMLTQQGSTLLMQLLIQIAKEY